MIAVHDDDRYGFFRGKIALQGVQAEPQQVEGDSFGVPAEAAGEEEAMGKPSRGKSVLRDNLFRQNEVFQQEQKDNYDGLLNNDRSGVKSKEAF